MNKAANLLSEAQNRLNKISAVAPEAAVILGSGVDVLNNLSESQSYSYKELFGIAPSVQGHKGSLELGRLSGKLIAVFRGRFHLYEGHDFETVTLPTLSLARWGVPRLYLTNAAGAINADFSVGDLMLITGYRDHMSPKWKEAGGLQAVKAPVVNCENELTAMINAHSLRRGVYAGVLGPCYETLAEVQMFKKLGADVVGMSTIPELQAAATTNIKAAAISVITNSWNNAKIHSHLEVVAAAQAASQRLDVILKQAILSI